MPAYAFLLWIVIGGIVGWRVSPYLGGAGPFGAKGDIVAGILGGIVLGYLLALLGGGSVILSLIAAAIGAFAGVWLLRKLRSGA